MTEEQLSALLRLKRYEQPPPGYYDQLLRDVHRRQRAELLRRPLWKIALERMQTFFGEHSISHTSYAGALASVLILGIAAISVFSPGGAHPSKHGPTMASNTASQGLTPVLTLQQGHTPQRPVFEQSPNFQTAYKTQATQKPRYVIDARPVSYEPSYSF